MWRTLDHTADVALEIEAESWPELLAEAARAFGEWLTSGDLPGDLYRTECALEVHGVDRVDTWVRFWRALHRIWAVEGFLPVHARIETTSSELGVTGSLGCVSASALDPARCLDVKAVTWHEAHVERRGARWAGTIVLDL